MEPLVRLLDRLHAAGVEAALGGSGLLYAHGLVAQVNDWDLTTDAAPDQVREALAGLPYADKTGGREFATRARLVVQTDGREIDLICQAAMRTDGGITRFPTIITGEFQGIPLGSMEVWAAFYWLMGRMPKAELALAHLRRHGADGARLARMLREPLPAALRAALEALQ